MPVKKGAKELEKEVIKSGLCTSCGACIGICPYINLVRERAIVIEQCGIDEGKCYNYCPRTYIDLSELDQKVFDSERKDAAIGSYISVLTGRAKDDELKNAAQDGGIVSALCVHVLDSEGVDGVVLAKSSDLTPIPIIAKTRGEVLQSAGSKYTVSPTLMGVKDAIDEEGIGQIGIVATPCQVTASRKMQGMGEESVKLVIGLFCMESFFSDGFYDFLRDKAGPSTIKKLDIKGGKLIVQTDNSPVEIKLSEVKQFARPTCDVCCDVTSEFADVSVGSIGSDDGWNTIIIRNKIGEELIKNAEDAGMIETKPLAEGKIELLRKIVLKKKRSSIGNIEDKKLRYLKLSEDDKSEIMEVA
ncbi:MAG: Coenzyme F420 hydrogenase/dehydrogenase, beta subunit C-terminal domain [Halobacteriota archaeon]|nr:Coenzyme F420 hydrogenase/dehydrogenase, beta subunit C-terminal domain [Halobacteriota archaeon]